MALEVTEVELMLKRKNRLAEERKAVDFRAVEREKRAEAQRLRGLESSARSAQLAKMRATDARRLESEADRCATEAARADERAKRFALDEELIAVRLSHVAPSAALGRDASDWQIT
jgi:ribosomal protein L44E